MGSLAEKKLTVWQKIIGELKSVERTWPAFIFFLYILSVFLLCLSVFNHVCMVTAIFGYFLSIFACFLVLIRLFLPNVKSGRTV